MKKIFIVVFITMLSSFSYAKIELPETISVGLSYGSNAVETFTVYAKSGVKIKDVGTVKGNVTFKKKGTDEILITTDASSKKYTCEVDDDGILISPVSEKEYLKYKDTQYRGNLIVYRFSDSDITVVNVLNLEEYLYGVVPKEMASGHPTEALKAQAVVARSYACQRVGRYSKWNFDVTNTTLDQAYGGYSVEKKDTNAAVDETAGEVVTYKGEVASTCFFSTSGGYTEAAENVWTSSVPYLQPVEDKYQSEEATYANWNLTFNKDAIEEIFEDKDITIGNLLGINIVKKSDSGGVINLEFVGSQDTYNVEKEKTRTFLGLKSQCYDIKADNSVSIIGKDGQTKTKSIPELKVATGKKPIVIPSKIANVTVLGIKNSIKYKYVPSEYTLNGKGYGHGVGMSQTGAIGMAKADFDYKEILKWYYTDIEVVNGEEEKS